MFSWITRKCVLAIALAALPVAALSATLTVNGTCEAGSCPSVDTLQPGGSAVGSFDLTYMLPNNDSYHVFGTYNTQNSSPNGTTNVTQMTAVYMGNASNTASQADLLTVDFLQNYNYTATLDGTYKGQTAAFLGGPLGGGSSFDAQVYYDNTGLGLMGPFSTAGYHFASTSANLTGLTNPLSLDFRVHFNFGAGSGVGATESTLTPEPGSMVLSLVAFAALAARKTGARSRGAGNSETEL